MVHPGRIRQHCWKAAVNKNKTLILALILNIPGLQGLLTLVCRAIPQSFTFLSGRGLIRRIFISQ